MGALNTIRTSIAGPSLITVRQVLKRSSWVNINNKKINTQHIVLLLVIVFLFFSNSSIYLFNTVSLECFEHNPLSLIVINFNRPDKQGSVNPGKLKNYFILFPMIPCEGNSHKSQEKCENRQF